MKATQQVRQKHEEEHYWPSFTDVMSSIVLVLFFFIVILLLKQIVSTTTWDKQLSSASASLKEKQVSLATTQQNLEKINSELNSKKKEMSSLEKSLQERETQISRLEADLSKDRIALDKKDSELKAVKGKLDSISLLRLSLLREVKSSIETELGTAFKEGNEPMVSIDNNANLIIQSSLLFSKGSSSISENGKKTLRLFAAAFGKILKNSASRDCIDSIAVSGYADSDDTYANNYTLSCERAIAVINTMMKENPALEKNYGKFFQASGFSEFRPLTKNIDEASKSKNRRIQISINIKDSQIQNVIKEYMNKMP